MRLYNSDVDEAERLLATGYEREHEAEDGGEDAAGSFFDLRQRTLTGIDQMSAFRIVAMGLLRKLRTCRVTVLYSEVEDAIGRYFRLLDADMQRFASLHEVLKDLADKQAQSVHMKPSASEGALPSMLSRAPRAASSSAVLSSTSTPAGLGRGALEMAKALLLEGMREIAVVLLACGEMQRRALELKMSAQRAISDHRIGSPPAASFSKFADFLEEALAVCDQLRRKHEELQQLRMRAMASATEARLAAAAAGGSGAQPSPAPTQPRASEGQRPAQATASGAVAAY